GGLISLAWSRPARAPTSLYSTEILWRTSPTRGRSTRFTCEVKRSIAQPCAGSGRNEKGTGPQEAQSSEFILCLMCLFVADSLSGRAIIPSSRVALLRWGSGGDEVLTPYRYQSKQRTAARDCLAVEALGDAALRVPHHARLLRSDSAHDRRRPLRPHT